MLQSEVIRLQPLQVLVFSSYLLEFLNLSVTKKTLAAASLPTRIKHNSTEKRC